MKKNTDILSGSLFKNMFVYSMPIILTGILQISYNVADTIVVGRYAGGNSLAAIGSTGSISGFFINLFIGLSVGTNVCVAQYIGAKESHSVKKAVHTSVCMAFWAGILLMILGLTFAKQCLSLMHIPDNIIGEATLYMRIIFIGMPFNLIYNFCAAILRASGNTKTPLLILSFSGIINVILNLVLVIVFNRGADGVGIATIFSQFISMCLIIRYLLRENSDIRLIPSELKIHKSIMLKIMRIGIPSGIQNTLASVSMAIIQSSINTFGSVAIAGNSAAGNIETLANTPIPAFYLSTLTFTGQILGAKKYKQLKRILLYGCIQVTIVQIIFSSVALIFGRSLLNLYTPGDIQVINYGYTRIMHILPFSFLCGIMDISTGGLRGMGASLSSVIASILGRCLLRVVWVYTVFAHFKTLTSLYYSYPATWIITSFIQFTLCAILIHRFVSSHKS